MYTLINGSHRNNDANTYYFLNILKDYLSDCTLYNLTNNNYNEILKNIMEKETIILAFPLYVDSPPSKVVAFLDYFYDNNIVLNKKLYVIINCGFKEAKHNITALNIIKNWANKQGITYQGSLLIGSGEIIGKKKHKIISSKALKKLKRFSICIMNNKKTNDEETTINYLNNYLFCIIGNIFWKRKIKKNLLNK